MPDPTRTERILEEPFIQAQIITKPEYIGNIITLCLGTQGYSIESELFNANSRRASFRNAIDRNCV